MKTLKNLIIKINPFLEKHLSNYINNATGAFFPKSKTSEYVEDDDDDEPILFI